MSRTISISLPLLVAMGCSNGFLGDGEEPEENTRPPLDEGADDEPAEEEEEEIDASLVDDDGDVLGEEQWAWLRRELTNSTAAAHLIVSSIQVLTTSPVVESWGHYPRSRRRLLELLREKVVDDKLLLTRLDGPMLQDAGLVDDAKTRAAKATAFGRLKLATWQMMAEQASDGRVQRISCLFGYISKGAITPFVLHSGRPVQQPGGDGRALVGEPIE